MTSVVERLAAKVKHEDDCLVWTAYTDNHGYGIIKVAGKPRKAHRVAYEITNGPIPYGLVIDHICRNRACVNVDHLLVVTRQENTLADNSLAVSKAHADKTHCVRGHKFSGKNLAVDLHSGKRSCRECNRIRSRESYWRKRGRK